MVTWEEDPRGSRRTPSRDGPARGPVQPTHGTVPVSECQNSSLVRVVRGSSGRSVKDTRSSRTCVYIHHPCMCAHHVHTSTHTHKCKRSRTFTFQKLKVSFGAGGGTDVGTPGQIPSTVFK